LAKEIAAPLRLAVSVPVSIDIHKTGEWTILPAREKIWRQSVFMPDALGMIISYEDFYIPEGGKLFIYNDDKSQVLGAYTHETNPAGGRFSTEIISGDKFTFEYVASTTSSEQPRVVVNDIGYIYDKQEPENTTRAYLSTPTPNTSDACMININCSEGDNWQKQKRGVVHLAMKFSNGWYVCSGSLVNNSNNDGKPYLLTANHCFYEDNPVKVADYATSQFYFNYEYPSCSNGTGVPASIRSLIGSALKVRLPLSNRSDGLLLELNSPVPTEWNPYYNGWDASNSAVTSGVVIHHPDGDVKKISTFTQPLTSTRWEGTNPSNSFWEVKYSATANGHSVTQGGSSGSPIFNQNGLIVGTLTGGESYCTVQSDGGPDSPDVFGKMWYHYNQSSIASQKMKDYLAPNVTITSLQGYDPNGSDIRTERVDVKIALFPNPVTDELNVNAKGIIEYIRIIDALGHLAYEAGELKSSTTAVPVSTWPSGMYFVTVKTDSGTFTGKVMKN
jgi:hypothetical protein